MIKVELREQRKINEVEVSHAQEYTDIEEVVNFDRKGNSR